MKADRFIRSGSWIGYPRSDEFRMVTIFDFWFVCFSLLAFGLSWILPRKAQPGGIAVCTSMFLLLNSPESLGILLLSSILVYLLMSNGSMKMSVVITLIAGVAAIFSYFKLRIVTSSAVIFMPLGLSYYSFRQIHYIFEKQNRSLSGDSFYNFVSYMLFLPTFIVGPINRYNNFLRDIRRRRWDAALISRGLERILVGYFKVVFIAGFLLQKGSMLLIDGGLQGLLAIYLKHVIGWLNLFVIFSGYSDVAIGLALLSGFRVMENFNYPFLAPNISEFWRRWHISLTSWVRDYVFYPIIAASRRQVPAILATLVIIGLWHEFSLRYVLWGVYHTVGILISHRFGRLTNGWNLPKIGIVRNGLTCLSILITFSFVVMSFPVTLFLESKILSLLR